MVHLDGFAMVALKWAMKPSIRCRRCFFDVKLLLVNLYMRRLFLGSRRLGSERKLVHRDLCGRPRDPVLKEQCRSVAGARLGRHVIVPERPLVNVIDTEQIMWAR
jgi:hypothetical protein